MLKLIERIFIYILHLHYYQYKYQYTYIFFLLKGVCFIFVYKIMFIESYLQNLRLVYTCLLYTSDAADDMQCVDLGGRRIIKKKNIQTNYGDQTYSQHKHTNNALLHATHNSDDN
eukprot:TRINITY_DN15238_c0_g1_i3.p1 TRINITY_DN15238_c0_g1~~TRINITY_DN15238_c0_g1_i3.p1  ORF type:complete len:115 (-),score=4.86 TRINITY_DN15238_c0_g1_i3:12-356(-)